MDSVPGRSNKLQPWEVSSGTPVLQSDATGLLLIKIFIQINLCALVLVYLSLETAMVNPGNRDELTSPEVRNGAKGRKPDLGHRRPGKKGEEGEMQSEPWKLAVP